MCLLLNGLISIDNNFMENTNKHTSTHGLLGLFLNLII